MIHPKPINQVKHHYNSFKLYFAMRDRGYSSPYYNTFLGFIAYAPLTLSLIFFLVVITQNCRIVNINTIVLISLTCVIVSALILFRKQLIYLSNYKKFKNWQEQLSFKIEGSDKLLSNPELLIWFNWFEYCGIKINFSVNCSEETKALTSAAMSNFLKNAEDVVRNFKIYIPWKLENNILMGSANILIIGIIQRFICNDLNKINILKQEIYSIEITTSKRLTHIEHIDINDD